MTSKGKTFSTVVRDCLYLNWAMPLESLPNLPEPLRYEVHGDRGDGVVFASALLFRHESLHFAGVPMLRLSYPQFHLRLHVLDHNDRPAVCLNHILVPTWVVPGVRLLAHQPAVSGRFRYPRPSFELDSEQWKWEVRRNGSLAVAARQASPRVGPGPTLGTWEQVVDCFRMRNRAYVTSTTGLRAIDTTQRSVPLWPVEAEFEDLSLLQTSSVLSGVSEWPDLHSSWICPEIPFTFEMGREAVRAKLRPAAAPVAPDPAMFGSAKPQSRRSAA